MDRTALGIAVNICFTTLALLCGNASFAYADNCTIGINPEDCQNTAWTVGMVAVFGAGAVGAVAGRRGIVKILRKILERIVKRPQKPPSKPPAKQPKKPPPTKEQQDKTRKEFEKIREDYWKDEARTNRDKYSKEDLQRMEKGKPPIGKDGYPRELHHKEPIEKGGTNDWSNLEPMDRTDHRLGDNYRKNHP